MPAPNLPANPKVSGGVRLLFLGTGQLRLRGSDSGSTYFVSDHRRIFTAHARDVVGLLRHPDIIESR